MLKTFDTKIDVMLIIEQFYASIVLVCLLLMKSSKNVFKHKFLGAVVILLLYSEITRIILDRGGGEIPEFIIITGYMARALFVPAAYLYFRRQLEKQQLQQSDFIHLLPFVLFCLGSTLANFLNADIIFPSQSTDLQTYSAYSVHGIALTCFRIFVYCFTGLYSVLLLIMIRKHYRAFERPNERVKINGTGSTVNGHGEKVNEVSPVFHLTDEKMKHMDIIVKEFIAEKQPFLQHGYTLRHLSGEMNVPLHHLSAFINHYYKMNFNDFINEYRVSHCKIKIVNEEWRYKKLEAIAGESGFSNRNTFTSAFKKVTGLNPSAYLKKLREEMEYNKVSLNGLHQSFQKENDL